MIRLPQSVTIGDQFAIPAWPRRCCSACTSRSAAAPTTSTSRRSASPSRHDGATSEALLLHDVVPGGTGYLAELANPERMWDLLHRAWERVRDCPCQHEQRLACHRCLVPFAPARSAASAACPGRPRSGTCGRS